jgi:F0F1-type ATP synthase delta subunit
MSKVPRRTLSEAVAAHLYYTDVHGTKEYVRDRKKYIQSVASYLLETGRTRELDSILRDISADWARVGYPEALVRTAFPLTLEARTAVDKTVKQLYPKAERVLVTERHDPQVIGGAQISVANQRLDLSVVGKLNKFKQLTGAGKD